MSGRARRTRRPPRPRTTRSAQLLADLEQSGAQAAYWSADVADADALRSVVTEVAERFGPIHGAFHGALQLRDGALSAMTRDDLDTVLAAKLHGSIALLDALEGQPLDVVAFFSSALSFVPAPGQANYAAAGHFQDAFALAARRRGVPAVVVNWGFWGSVGAVATPEQRERFESLGIAPIETVEGLDALERIVSAGLAQAVVAKGTADGLALLGVPAGHGGAGRGRSPLRRASPNSRC